MRRASSATASERPQARTRPPRGLQGVHGCPVYRRPRCCPPRTLPGRTGSLVAVTVLALCTRPLAAKWINSFAGPFVTTVGPRMEPCVKSEHLVRIDMKIPQFRNGALEYQTSLQRLTGNATLTIPISAKGVAYMKAASRSNNQWKENAYVMKFPSGMCVATMQMWPDFVRKIYKLDPDEQLKKGHDCMVPKGTYLADDVPINWTIPQLTVFPYSTWLLEAGFLSGPEPKAKNWMCLTVEVTTRPKL